MVYLIFALLIATLVLALVKLATLKNEIKKYQPIIDLNLEIDKLLKSKEHLELELSALHAKIQTASNDLLILTEDGNLIESGFYRSKYNFKDSSEYADKLKEIREKQKQQIKDKTAIICRTEWRVGDSRTEGKKMTERTIKLGLSAFNVQCDNEILNVRFDNIDRAEDKIYKIRDVVNKLLEPNHCEIQDSFVNLKISELHVAYEYQQKLRAEKEEQKELREQMREEEKARREAERAEAEAEKEERRYSAALEKARIELRKQSADTKDAYMAKIAELEFKLSEAHVNKERAKSLAEQTRMGHVYIISNIGSFGEDIFKIGMTRRLDPIDRIDELSDASVPFDFDIHALIKTDDAPGLEKTLHSIFAGNRLNLVNERKEFFKTSLSEIEKACKDVHKGEFKITLIAEAQEFRQTVAQRKSKQSAA